MGSTGASVLKILRNANPFVSVLICGLPGDPSLKGCLRTYKPGRSGPLTAVIIVNVGSGSDVISSAQSSPRAPGVLLIVQPQPLHPIIVLWIPHACMDMIWLL